MDAMRETEKKRGTQRSRDRERARERERERQRDRERVRQGARTREIDIRIIGIGESVSVRLRETGARNCREKAKIRNICSSVVGF